MAEPIPLATTTCPNCGGETWRDEVDVEVGIIYGPYGCPCGWSEWDEYDQTKGPTAASGKRTDQWGYLYPTDVAASGARDSEVEESA
jgi:hypothetical protein